MGTKQPAYPASAQIEMQFRAVLLPKHRDGQLQKLKHFYRDVKWEERFAPVQHGKTVTGIRRTSTEIDNPMTVKPFVDGPVTDGDLAALIAAPNGRTCNERA